MAELLFEIFCEEIPARMQVKAGDDLARALTDGLAKAGLNVKDAQTFTGPRRLVFVADVPLKGEDVSEERKGPRVGAPEQALAGFMRGAGLSDIAEAETRSDKKGEFYVAVIDRPGLETATVLKELLPEIMGNFPWPKSMKSGTSSFRWVRPLQSMVCLLDGQVVEFEVGGVTSGNSTEGHRRHGKGPFEVKDFADYQAQLEGAGHVVLSHAMRREKILQDARKACAAKGLELVEDAGLLEEVAGLAEWPVVILGEMDESFLELPAEVIRLSMRTHQKYFAVLDPKTGGLAPNFIVVANQIAPDGGTAIAEGNSRVLSARLADAQFFQSEDAKQKLEEYYDKLDTVVFHKKLGSVRDKAERVAALARELAPIVGVDPDVAAQAAKLSKCDLVTQTVIEFTSLQGQIGRLMYEREGGAADVALAIEEHYKPQGPSDAVPTDPVSVTVALADKLDTLVGFWAIDEKPTGSKDPYALRRAALGVVSLQIGNEIKVSPRLLLEQAIKIIFPDSEYSQYAQVLDSLESFFETRLEALLKSLGHRIDVVRAVAAGRLGGTAETLPHYTWYLIALELEKFLESEAGADLLAGYKRTANILKAEAKKGELPEAAADKPSQSEAVALYEALNTTLPQIETALGEESYAKAMTALSELRAPIDDFFTHVTVNDSDETVRQNNLRLLGMIRDTARRIADFDAIQGE